MTGHLLSVTGHIKLRPVTGSCIHMMKKDGLEYDRKIMDVVKTDLKKGRTGLKLLTDLILKQSSVEEDNNEELYEELTTNFEAIIQHKEYLQEEKITELKTGTDEKISQLVDQNNSLNQENQKLKKLMQNLLKSQSQMTQNQEEEKEKLLKNQESRKKQNRQQDEGISTNTNWIYLLASLISLLSVQSNLAVRNEGS